MQKNSAVNTFFSKYEQYIDFFLKKVEKSAESASLFAKII